MYIWGSAVNRIVKQITCITFNSLESILSEVKLIHFNSINPKYYFIVKSIQIINEVFTFFSRVLSHQNPMCHFTLTIHLNLNWSHFKYTLAIGDY